MAIFVKSLNKFTRDSFDDGSLTEFHYGKGEK